MRTKLLIVTALVEIGIVLVLMILFPLPEKLLFHKEEILLLALICYVIGMCSMFFSEEISAAPSLFAPRPPHPPTTPFTVQFLGYLVLILSFILLIYLIRFGWFLFLKTFLVFIVIGLLVWFLARKYGDA